MPNLVNSVDDTISHLKGLVSKIDSIPRSSEHIQALTDELLTIATKFQSIAVGEEFCTGTASVVVAEIRRDTLNGAYITTGAKFFGYIGVKFQDGTSFLTRYTFHGSASELAAMENSSVICKRCGESNFTLCNRLGSDSIQIGNYYYYGFEFKDPAAISY